MPCQVQQAVAGSECGVEQVGSEHQGGGGGRERGQASRIVSSCVLKLSCAIFITKVYRK